MGKANPQRTRPSNATEALERMKDLTCRVIQVPKGEVGGASKDLSHTTERIKRALESDRIKK